VAPAAPARAAPTATLEAPPLGLQERRARLSVLAETVKNCTRCGLHAGRQQTVFSRGDPGAELCFVGEGPGADEDAQGEPFVGKAGQLLDKMIAAMGLRRDEVYIANCVKCRPPNNRTPEAPEMASCMPYLHEQLEVIRPRVIVALGATALRGLMGTTEGITKVRGTWRLYQGAIPVMPTFHPSYVLRMETKEVRGMVWSDLQQVLKELGRSPPARP
jgi:uracil-DNA glycosylase family 4